MAKLKQPNGLGANGLPLKIGWLAQGRPSSHDEGGQNWCPLPVDTTIGTKRLCGLVRPDYYSKG
jgi:hypothetical protein